MREVAQLSDAIGESHHRQGRGKGEAEPGGEAAGIPGAKIAQRDGDLAARRTGQELAKGDEVGIGGLVEPFAAADEFGAKIGEMRHGATEARES